MVAVEERAVHVGLPGGSGHTGGCCEPAMHPVWKRRILPNTSVLRG